ncbi:hypothetical protein LCM00_22205 [Bacillus infantis]|nr:hypothetical protein [Bacillus infantis]MCA1042215.1 hypothetical protein [Bacillus infantis]
MSREAGKYAERQSWEANMDQLLANIKRLHLRMNTASGIWDKRMEIVQ